MENKYYNITLAFACLIQSVSLIRELAQTGKMDEAAFQTSIHSIFQTDPKDINSVYGNISDVKIGLKKIIHIFSPRANTARTLLRYTLALIRLQKKISRRPKLQQQLAQRIQQAKKQADYFHLTHPTVIANLADAYLSIANHFKFRVIIWGTQRSLSAIDNMEKIRALLLAGLRATFLWRQMGGSGLQLILFRSKIKTMAEKILAQIEQMEAQQSIQGKSYEH